MAIPCEENVGQHLYAIEESREPSVHTIMTEDMERRKIIKRVTNVFAVAAMLDALISFSLIIYLLRQEQFTDIAALISCMQIACFLFLSLVAAILMLKSKNFDDRIDAIGAWVVVHFINLFGNISLVVFELWPDPLVVVDTSFTMTMLICWKGLFIVIELISTLYCFYIAHKPVVYFKEQIRTRHPLFNDESNHVTSESINNRTTHTQQEQQLSEQLRRPISVISNGNTHNGQSNLGRYDSYLSLTQNVDTRYVRNPCYESELSLEYANNYSPYDDMMLANRNRLSYVERLPRVLPEETAIERNRPYLHNGSMSNRNSYISNYDAVTNQLQHESSFINTVEAKEKPVRKPKRSKV